jgi:tetratricopeptide (TPR) repeat protein
VQYAKALHLQPSHAAALRWMGGALQQQGRRAAALEYFERAAQLDPLSPEAWVALAGAQSSLRDYPAARGSIDRAIVLAPDVLDPYLMRADLELRLRGDRAAARRLTHDAIARFGAERVASSAHPVLLGALDTAELAALESWHSPELARRRPDYLLWKAQLNDRLNRSRLRTAYADSLRLALEPIVRAGPDDYDSRALLARAYAWLGRADDAARLAEQALMLPGGEHAVLVRYQAALVYMTLGRYDAATDQLEHLLSLPTGLSVAGLRADPSWAPLREHARFQRLVADTSGRS